MRKNFIGILLLFSLVSYAGKSSEKDSKNIYTKLNTSFIFGGQIYNDNFNYNPGLQFELATGVRINSYLSVGGGFGYQHLTNENFLPIYFETTGMINEKPNPPFLKMRFGYSAGWYDEPVELENYSYKGGMHFEVSIGKQFFINPQYAIFFELAIRHQFASIEYSIYNTTNYEEILNYDMAIFTLGLSHKNKTKKSSGE